MKTSPFKVMTSAALASALAVPAVATTAPSQVDAAETEILDIAIEVDGEVKTVSYDEFVNALFDGSGEVYDLYTEGEIVAVSVEEGQYVKYEALANAVFDAEEGTTTTELLAELNTEEDALVDEEVVAEYDNFVGETGDLAIADLEAVGNDTLKVEFNQEVDPEEAEITLDRGTVSVGIENITFAEDNMSATITANSRFTDSDYTVNVSGLTEEDLTETITLQEERVEDVEFLSENAVITEDQVGNTYLVASYKVENQYGESITKQTSLSATSSMGTATITQPGKVQVDVTNFANQGTLRVGDKVSFTLVHKSGVTESATLEVSKKAAASKFEVQGLYNADDDKETLKEGSTGFKLLVDVVDQYGNVMSTDKANEQVFINSTNPFVLSLPSSGTNTPFETVYVDGEKQTAISLNPQNAGEASVNFISSLTGETLQYEVEVAPGQKVTDISLFSPEIAVAGETVQIPFTAYNANGEEVTDRAVLKDASKGVQVTSNGVSVDSQPEFKYDPSTGETVLEVKPLTKGYLTVTAQPRTVTEDFSVSSVSMDVKAEANPVSITGIETIDTTPFYKNVLLNESWSFQWTDLQMEDQYGRAMFGAQAGDLVDFTSTVNNGDYAIGVAKGGSNNVSLSVDSNVTTTPANGVQYDLMGQKTTATYGGSAEGTENFSFVLLERVNGAWELVPGSSFDTNIKTVVKEDIESFEVSDIATVYDESENNMSEAAAYTKSVMVTGVMPDGTKVFVPKSGNEEYYSLNTNNIELTTGATGSGDYGTVNAVESATADIYYAQGTTESELSATVTINHTGDMITKSVTTSYADPTVAFTGFPTADANKWSAEDAVEIAENTTELDTAAEALSALYVEDQYGAAATNVGSNGLITFADGSTTNVATTVTFTNFLEGDDSTQITVANNASTNASISNLESGDEYDIVYSYPNGETAKLHVVVE